MGWNLHCMEAVALRRRYPLKMSLLWCRAVMQLWYRQPQSDERLQKSWTTPEAAGGMKRLAVFPEDAHCVRMAYLRRLGNCCWAQRRGTRKAEDKASLSLQGRPLCRGGMSLGRWKTPERAEGLPEDGEKERTRARDCSGVCRST